MNPTLFRRSFSIAAIATLALGSVRAFAAVDCAHPQGIGEVRGCAAARQGPDALRRFVERTRAIYMFWYYDFAAPGPAVAANETVKVATRATR